jgi:uncharacterized protein (TIGR03000 family)
MLRTMTPKALGLLTLAAVLAWCVSYNDVRAQSADQPQVIVITVRLPDDAVLLIDDHKMQLTGAERVFKTPPVPAEGHYAYTLKATSKGKEVIREIKLAHGMDNIFDLRAEFLGAAKGIVPAKNFTASSPLERPYFYSTINWGAALRTVEAALDTQPSDGSRYPK